MLTDKPVPASLELAQELSQSEGTCSARVSANGAVQGALRFSGTIQALRSIVVAGAVHFVRYVATDDVRMRANLLRLFGARIGKSTIIRPSVKIPVPLETHHRDHCHIGDDVHLYTYGRLRSGTAPLVSQRSYLCTGSHDYTSPTFDIFAKKIVIGAEAWVRRMCLSLPE